MVEAIASIAEAKATEESRERRPAISAHIDGINVVDFAKRAVKATGASERKVN